MRYILIGLLIVGCGDTFESQLFLEGQNDGQAGATGIEASSIKPDTGSDSGGPDATDNYIDSFVTDLGDSSPIETGQPGDGDAGNDATPEAETSVTCDPWQCQTTCASQGKLCNECQCV